MSEPTQVAPGWYDDPEGPGKRYWDGQQWAAAPAPTTAGGEAAARPPWYARPAVRIGAMVAGGVGVILLIVGVVTFLGAGDTQDEADELTAEADEIEAEVASIEGDIDAARQTAEELPALTADLDGQIASATAAIDATVQENNSFIDCLNAAVDNQTFNACVQSALPAIEAALAAEVEASNQLEQTVTEAEEAVAATTGGGGDDEGREDEGGEEG